jgi:hypothetical protein
VTSQVGQVATDVLSIVGFLNVTRRARAAMAGAKAGVALLKGTLGRR